MDSRDSSEQYESDENLRIRIETHQRFTVGPPLEPAIDAALMLRPDESLLDVGTGPGSFPQRLRQAGHRGRLVGVDASAGMIAKATSAGADVEFLEADAASLPFPDGSFDVVTARHMLYHVPDIPRALREARRVLRAGGRFLAVTNIHDSMGEYRRAIDEAADRLKGEIADVMRMSIATADAFSERNGPGLIEKAFGNVATTLVHAALRFETAEPALRYFVRAGRLEASALRNGRWRGRCSRKWLPADSARVRG